MAEDLLGFPSLCSFYQTQSVHKQIHRHCNHHKLKSLHLPQGNGKPKKASQQRQAISVFPLHVVTQFFFKWWDHAWVHCSVIICQDKFTDMIKEKLLFNKKYYSISHFLFFLILNICQIIFFGGKKLSY